MDLERAKFLNEKPRRPSGFWTASPFQTRGRLELLLVSVIIAPIFLFAAAAYYDRIQLFQAAERDVQSAAAFSREHTRKAFETQELLIRELDHRVQGMTWDEIRASAKTLSAEIYMMHAGLPQVSIMGLTDTEARLLTGSSTFNSSGYIHVDHREFWTAQRDADQGTFISETYVGSVTGRLNFAISRRRTSAPGVFDGTVHVAVASSYFSDFWAEATKDRQGIVVALVRRDGTILARFPRIERPIPDVVVPTGAFMRHLDDGERSGIYQAPSATDGVTQVYAYDQVGAYPVFVLYGISVQSILDTWFTHLLALGGICALAAMALVLAVLSTMRQMRRLREEQARRLAIEEAALDGQRLELLGQLAAGVAHDFRNIVHAVRNGADLIDRSADQPDRIRSLARVIHGAAEQGASLTQRMLDLARRGRGEDGTNIITDATANPAEAILNVQHLLARTLGSHYALRCEVELEGFKPRIYGDRLELEAALMNLAVNARDAMPDGGEVVIRCKLENVDTVLGGTLPADQGAGDAQTRFCIRISVSDTGVGMSAEVLSRAGELFFTTKPRGRGTGLGLAGARGFAERAGGKLAIESGIGMGTTVHLFLPGVAEDAIVPGDLAPGNNLAN